jgi:multimeric flavodoxin WrbA
MRVTIFDGTGENDPAAIAVNSALARAVSARSWTAETLVLRDMHIPHCIGCFECWVRTPGLCIAKGDCDTVARTFIGSDVVVLLTRVTFGGYSSQLKKALDHLIGLDSPFFKSINGEIHHKKRYGRYPSLLAVGLQHNGNAEQRQIFETLVARNAINTHAPSHRAIVLAGEPDETTLDAQMRDAFQAIGGNR